MMFGVAFPMAQLLALVNNLIELRIDAYKLLKWNRRTLCKNNVDIGVFEELMHFLALMAVFVNIAILALDVPFSAGFKATFGLQDTMFSRIILFVLIFILFRFP